MVRTADAVVIGGGVMGTSILYNLVAQGVKNAVLLEKDVLASGSTSRSQAILRMHYSNEVTARMAWESLKLFKDLDQFTGVDSGYVRTGYFLVVGESDRPALQANVSMLRRPGVNTEEVRPEDVAKISPILAAQGNEALAYEPDSGYADAYTVTTVYARRAREMGAWVEVGAAAVGIETAGGKVSAVITDAGRIETDTAVVATGPWSRPLLLKLGGDVPLETIRHQVVMLRHREDRVPDHPVIGDVVNGLSARPHAGNLTLIGVGEEERVAPDEYNHGVDMPVVRKTMASLALRMPGMAEALFRGGWSGLFTVTPDWHPILSKVEGVMGLYLAVGFSGHGFKLSPMVGVVMAELVTQGEATSVDISMLGLDRFEGGRLLGSRYSMSVLA